MSKPKTPNRVRPSELVKARSNKAEGVQECIIEINYLLKHGNPQQRALREIKDSIEPHIDEFGGDVTQDPECVCVRCVAVRALSVIREQALRLADASTEISDGAN